MSKLATVSVVQCDHCRQVAVLATEIQWQTFQRLWHEGPVHDFCHVCRERDDVRRTIHTDELRWQAAIEKAQQTAVGGEAKEEVKVEYAH
ncbi:MAG: hypothetical protein AB7L70_19290 [Pyrinomonadaceae bacterium]